jgi:anti-anti-sigma factor
MRGVSESPNAQASTCSSRKPQFSLTSFREAQRIVVRACGRLILGQGADQDLWAAHVDRTTATIVALDLSCVDDIDARGLGVLAGLVRRARQRGRTVSIMSASRVVQRLMKMARLDQVLPAVGTNRMDFPTACRRARACTLAYT